jgi:hypothetical protein
VTGDRYAEFLESPLGRWLDAVLPSSPRESAPAAVQHLLVWLADEVTHCLTGDGDPGPILELVDLIAYRLYGFTREDVWLAERYLSGNEQRGLVEGVLPLGPV